MLALLIGLFYGTANAGRCVEFCYWEEKDLICHCTRSAVGGLLEGEAGAYGGRLGDTARLLPDTQSHFRFSPDTELGGSELPTMQEETTE